MGVTAVSICLHLPIYLLHISISFFLFFYLRNCREYGHAILFPSFAYIFLSTCAYLYPSATTNRHKKHNTRNDAEEKYGKYEVVFQWAWIPLRPDRNALAKPNPIYEPLERTICLGCSFIYEFVLGILTLIISSEEVSSCFIYIYIFLLLGMCVLFY